MERPTLGQDTGRGSIMRLIPLKREIGVEEAWRQTKGEGEDPKQ